MHKTIIALMKMFWIQPIAFHCRSLAHGRFATSGVDIHADKQLGRTNAGAGIKFHPTTAYHQTARAMGIAAPSQPIGHR